MKFIDCFLVAFLAVCTGNIAHVTAVNTLKKYNIDADKVTVSGISSGAAMAVQLNVAYSSLINGVGVVAGPPYYCAKNSALTATTACMSGLSLFGISLSSIDSTVQSYYKQGLIDDPANLLDTRAYVFSGIFDTIVSTIVVKKTEDFYKSHSSPSNVKAVYTTSATHGFITNNYGVTCSILASNFLNNCNYNQAYHIAEYVYPKDTIVEPAKDQKATGTLIEINQKEFFPLSISSFSLSMDDSAYVYVPDHCAQGNKCKLHVALHGCAQGIEKVGLDFIMHSGFNPVADLNDMIILYPQAVKNSLGGNPNGCWDWWGYTNSKYATNEGPQMKAIKAMIDRIIG